MEKGRVPRVTLSAGYTQPSSSHSNLTLRGMDPPDGCSPEIRLLSEVPRKKLENASLHLPISFQSGCRRGAVIELLFAKDSGGKKLNVNS